MAGDDGALAPEDKGSLYSELDLLAERGIITKHLRESADEVRALGNDVAHPEELGEITETDAKESLGFLDDFVETTIAVPTRVRKRRESKKEPDQSIET